MFLQPFPDIVGDAGIQMRAAAEQDIDAPPFAVRKAHGEWYDGVLQLPASSAEQAYAGVRRLIPSLQPAGLCCTPSGLW